MNAFPLQPSFDSLARALPAADPAELHGTLCGMLCADPALTGPAWLAGVTDAASTEPVPAPGDRDLLLALFDVTAAQLDSDVLSFCPVLPDEQDSLGERADALGHWCEGFLAGLGLGGMQRDRQLTPEVEEFLFDLAEISRLGFDTDQTTEDDEEAYMELVEYVRMGVLLVRQELLDSNPTTPTLWH